jgi:hypothetical protein
MNSWGLMQWLEGFAYFVAITGAISGGILFIIRSRRKSIEQLRQDLAKAWTNEGDISSEETHYITLRLKISDGELIGEIYTNKHDRLLDAHVNVAWGKAKLHVTVMCHRSVYVGDIMLNLAGNHNRLKWRLIGKKGLDWLPKNTTLWPTDY